MPKGMGFKGATLVLALLVALPAAASAVQEPQGWKAEALNGSCSVKRAVGSDGTTLALSRTPGNDLTTLAISGEGARRFSRQDTANVVLHLEPGGAVPAEAELSPEFIISPVTLYIRSEERSFLDRVAAARALRVQEGTQVMLDQDLTGLGAAILLLRDCERAGLQTAGIDAAQWQSLRAGPNPLIDLVKLVKVKDYPKDAVRARASGLVMVRLTVAASGRPEKCDYIVRSGHELLDRATCKIMLERARFQPAVGPDGKAVAAPYVTKIIWRTS
jgi:TonB family protein